MLARIMQMFAANGYQHQRRLEEAWLAKSTDLVELERRQRQLTYGKSQIKLF